MDRQKSKILDSHRENMRVSRLSDSRDDVAIEVRAASRIDFPYEVSGEQVGGFSSFETNTPEVDGWWSGFFAASETLPDDWTPKSDAPGALGIPRLGPADARPAGALIKEVIIQATTSGTLKSDPFDLSPPRSVAVPVNELSAFQVGDMLTPDAARGTKLPWDPPGAAKPGRLKWTAPRAGAAGTLPMPAPPALSTRSISRAEHPWPGDAATRLPIEPFPGAAVPKIPGAVAALGKKVETPAPRAQRSKTLAMPAKVEPPVSGVEGITLAAHDSLTPSVWNEHSAITRTAPAPAWDLGPSVVVVGLEIDGKSRALAPSLPEPVSIAEQVPSYADVPCHGEDLRVAVPDLVSEPYRAYDPDLIQFPAPPRRYEVVLEPGTVGKWWAGKLPPVARTAPSRSAPFAERLRSLIGPPVNELLADADMMLPEAPFQHQVQGISWLYSRDAGILADQLGLGKTMQAILASRLLWRDGAMRSVVVICPRALVPHWVAEVEKWWPQARGAVAVPQNDDVKALLERDGEDARIKVVDYDSLARVTDWLKEQPLVHDLAIVDEAQQLLAAQSPPALAVRALRSERRWALTGLDVQKHLPLAASIFAFVRPELAEYSDPDAYAQDIRTQVLRRSIAETGADLPNRFEHELLLDLNASQRVAYGRAETEGAQQLRMKGDTATPQQALITLNRLRQICSIGPEAGTSAKLERLLNDVDEIAAAGAKAVIFVQPVCAVRVADALAARGHPALQVHDNLPRQRLDAMAVEFANDPKYRVLMMPFAGPIVGGKAAQYVLMFDNAWNPVFQERLMRRVCEFKDDRKLVIRRYVARDTVEQRLSAQIAQGRRLFWHLIDESRPAEGLGLSESELFQVLGVRPRAVPTPAAPPRVILEHLDMKQFEIMVASLYEKQGYKVTFDAGIEGVDLVAERVLPLAVERFAIVIKHQRTVIARAVLDQLAALVQRERSFTQGDVVTSAGFMADAPSYVRGKKLTLIDRNMLQRQCDRFQVARFVIAPP